MFVALLLPGACRSDRRRWRLFVLISVTGVDLAAPADRAVPLMQPAEPADVVAFAGTFKSNSGHTEWVDGRVHQSGFTATFAPNTKVLYAHADGYTCDVDWTNHQEGLGGREDTIVTYAAVTSRSFHAAGVNTCRLDGSTGPIPDTIDLQVWQTLSTRNGAEVINMEF